MTNVREQIPAVDVKSWEAWQTFCASTTDNMFNPLSNDRLNGFHDNLSEKLIDNPKKLLLTFLEPEIQKILYSPGQRKLSQEELAEIRLAIESYEKADLQYDSTEAVYLDYLEQWTGINQKSPDIVQAFREGNNEKVIAHTALAYKHLTEKESHIVPLTDMRSIIAHAIRLYSQQLSPWWDFATNEDYSSKSDHDISKKTPAPLFREKDCPTIAQFFAKVLPKIMELRDKDPKAALKIFPQSKNVEAFNWRISKDRDNNTTWIFEWYPGAYTPREGEDGERKFVKNRKVSKEERIVRAIVKFDSNGNPIIGLKSQKDEEGNDIPFFFPTTRVDISSLFSAGIIVDNHDDKISSNNPFVFIKYLATNQKTRELITTFESVHSQFGNADMVVSGMIGPEIFFFMDIDIETPSNIKTDADYIDQCLKQKSTHVNMPNSIMFTRLMTAPIIHELELQTIATLETSLSTDLHELFMIAEAGYIDHQRLTRILEQLELDDLNLSYYEAIWVKRYLSSILTHKEYEIIRSMARHRKTIDETNQDNNTDTQISKYDRKMTKRARFERQVAASHVTNIRRSLPGVITPTAMEIVTSSRTRHVAPSNLALKVKTLADL